MCLGVHSMSVGALQSQKRVLDLLQLELQVFVFWHEGTGNLDPRSSARVLVLGDLYHWAISPASCLGFWDKVSHWSETWSLVYAGQAGSPSEPPISPSPALGLQVCHHAWLFLWVLWLEVRPSNLSKPFYQWSQLSGPQGNISHNWILTGKT